jgi:hypothetical protein
MTTHDLSPNLTLAPRPNVFKRLIGRLKAGWEAIRPDAAGWKGAAFGIIVLGLIVVAVAAAGQGNDPLSGTGYFLWLAALAALMIALVDLITRVLLAMPKFYRAVFIGGAVILAMSLFQNLSVPGTLLVVGAILIPGTLLGAGAWTLVTGRWPALTKGQRIALVTGIFLGGAILIAAVAWYVWPGPGVPVATPSAVAANTRIVPLEVADPSLPGSYEVQTLTYGSGADRRPEFGIEAALTSRTVDGSPFVGRWNGLSGNLRTRYWGFDVTELPLNGRVWYPAGEGPFPLALIVHGNHSMMDDSDPGYAYLGELLASRGMILVSVDENFLNGSWMDYVSFGSFAGLDTENDGRGWLLLEHLAQWQRWNGDPGNPFYGKVDMDRIAVMGHSRGGEAAAIAASFNDLAYYPDDASVKLPYGFNIRAVVAIAPADGQYRPANQPTPLENVNYLVIQGAQDGDMAAFEGIRQYNRVQFTDDGDWFKAGVYVDRANHGQFNTTWGRSDSGAHPSTGLLNLGALMPADEQLQVAKVFISAFLEAALNGRNEYRPLFENALTGQAWLPDNAYLTRYEESGTRYLATFDEDVDVTTASIDGLSFDAGNLTNWHEGVPRLKWWDQQTGAVFLGWDRAEKGGTAFYRLEFEDESLRPSAGDMLVFALASGNPGAEAIDLTIALEDDAHHVASLPLSDFALLLPQFEFHTAKAGLLENGNNGSAEPVFQTYFFPLKWFQQENPDFNPAALERITFLFGRSETGLVILDDLGFRS